MTDLKDFSTYISNSFSSSTPFATQMACALQGYRALIIPGLGNTDEQHWLSRWEQHIPGARRIRLHDWNCADWVKWRNSIIASLISIDEPVVLIAQGFGALAAASVAAEYPGKVLATLLIDPADADGFDVRKKLPKQSLPQPARIVMGGSSFTAEDHAKAAFLALSWGADFSPTPHDSDAIWPEAVEELRELVAKAQHNQAMKLRNRKAPKRAQRFQLKLTTALAF